MAVLVGAWRECQCQPPQSMLVAVQASGTKDCEESENESWGAQVLGVRKLRARSGDIQQRSGRDLGHQTGHAVVVVCIARDVLSKG